jgi:hypothetical protein
VRRLLMHGDSGYAYSNWGIAITMIAISLFFIFKFNPMKTRPPVRAGSRSVGTDSKDV